MTASYPSSIKTNFVTHVNTTEVIDAGHPNVIQDEVVAIESTLGVNPQTSTTPSPTGTFSATSTSYTNLTGRLANIETGIVADTHTQYVRKAADGSNTVVPNSATTKGLVIQAASGQTANLQEWQNSSGTVVTYIDANGNFNAGSPDINAQTGSYTAAISDANRLVTINSASPATITLNQTVFTAGQQVSFARLGAGTVTFSAGTGVTIYSTGATTAAPTLRAQYSTASAYCLGSNTFLIVGDIA